jgi:hypothetical protein
MNKVFRLELSSRQSEVLDAMIAANNHYSGFGPGTVSIFRTMVGQTELSWQDQEHIQRQVHQAKQGEKEQQFTLSNTPSRVQKRKRQSRLTEYIE